VVPVDPFLSLWWMTTRGTLNGYRLGPEQAITPAEALRLYTIDNAVVLGVADRVGSLEPGKLADLVVLSQDILAVDPDRIRETRALLTMLGGRVVHRRGI
jgi:predicted amidohydrolase YtcJ